MRYICHFNLPDVVPPEGHISFECLGSSSGVDVRQMKQAFRFVMTWGFFEESIEDMISHTPGSRLLISGQRMRPFVQWLTEDCAPMVAHQLDALVQWGHGSQEPNETAVNHAYGTKGPFYEFIPADPVRERRFGAAMQQVSEQAASFVDHLVDSFDWQSLGHATVIDVGGHIGYCAVAIAEHAPKLNLIVQDRPEVVALAKDPSTSGVGSRVESRVSFEAHDFFQPQKTAADAFLFRKTLLNHTDKYVAKIVAALSPALRPGNRLLIMDFVQDRELSGSRLTERYYRAVDLQMLLYYNCGYRSLEEWIEAITAGDARLKFERICKPEGSSMAMMSFVYI